MKFKLILCLALVLESRAPPVRGRDWYQQFSTYFSGGRGSILKCISEIARKTPTDPIGATSSLRNPNLGLPCDFFWGGSGWLAPQTNRSWKMIPTQLFDLDIIPKICPNAHQKRNLDAPQIATMPPRRHYCHSDGLRVKEPGNVVRFRALVRLFRLSPKDVARTTGFSRSYVSRVLSRKDDFTGSHSFFSFVGVEAGDRHRCEGFAVLYGSCGFGSTGEGCFRSGGIIPAGGIMGRLSHIFTA
jgi:hypothetical protein